MPKQNKTDQLDDMIDQLFKEQPVAYNKDLTDRILAQAGDCPQDGDLSPLDGATVPFPRKLIHLTLAIAAVVTIAGFLPRLLQNDEQSIEQVALTSEAELDLEAVFILEDGIQALSVEDYAVSLDSLTLTLDALLFELES